MIVGQAGEGLFPEWVEKGPFAEIILFAAVLGALYVIAQKGVWPAFKAVRRVWQGIRDMVETWKTIEENDRDLAELNDAFERMRNENASAHEEVKAELSGLREAVGKLELAVEGVRDEVTRHTRGDIANFQAIAAWSKQFKNFAPIEVDMYEYEDLIGNG
jgi:hypothetical protein